MTTKEAANRIACHIVGNSDVSLDEARLFVNGVLDQLCASTLAAKLESEIKAASAILRNRGHDLIGAAKDAMLDLEEAEARVVAMRAEIERLESERKRFQDDFIKETKRSSDLTREVARMDEALGMYVDSDVKILEATRNGESRELAAMVNNFLRWPLPKSVCPDDCVMDRDYPHRIGTHLLTAVEAEQMFREVVLPVLSPFRAASGTDDAGVAGIRCSRIANTAPAK